MAVHGIKHDTNRVRLEDHIPLDSPFRINLELSSACNFHCQYCVHGNADTANQASNVIMKTALAKKCIDDMASFRTKVKSLCFFESGEPLLQKDIVDIVRYARDREVADTLSITTNGSMLTHSLSEQLIDAGLNHIDISIYGLSTQDYIAFCGVPVDFDNLVEQIRYLNAIPRDGSSLVVKINDACLHSESDKERFYQIFDPICDRTVIEWPVPIWYDFDSDILCQEDLDIRGNPVKEIEVCSAPFFMMSVGANGVASFCCMDWKKQLAVGDAWTESLESIWNGEKYKALRLKMLRDGKKSMMPCSSCGFPQFCGIDNIDPYRGMLLERLDSSSKI